MREPKPSQGHKVMFKRHAHLFTLISTVWTVFTLLAAFLVTGGGDGDSQIYLIAGGIWVVHALCISLSIYFWMSEKEKESVLWVEAE